jgi:hypothetical protein
MLALGRLLQQAQAEQDDQQYESGLVEQLVQRVAEAILLPDRREALQQLRDLLTGSSKAQLAFGAVGFPTLLQVVRDREDLEMVQLALESLAAVVGAGETGGDTQVQQREALHLSLLQTSRVLMSQDTAWLLFCMQAAAINAQQLARTPDGLPLLLAVLERGPGGSSDFYARYHALQVLKGLSMAAPRQLQEVHQGAAHHKWQEGMAASWLLMSTSQSWPPVNWVLTTPSYQHAAGHPGCPAGHDTAHGPAGRAGGAAQRSAAAADWAGGRQRRPAEDCRV